MPVDTGCLLAAYANHDREQMFSVETRQRIFNYMSNEHNLSLLEPELDEILRIVIKNDIEI